MKDKNEIKEVVSEFDPEAFETVIKNSSKFVSFAELEQKKLLVGYPENVITNRFGEEKLLMRLKVYKVNDDDYPEPKQWDVTNPGLIKQLLVLFTKTKLQYYHIGVKRGPGLNKATNYVVWEL